MSDLTIMNYEKMRKTVLRNVEDCAKQIDIRIAFGDELADVEYLSGKSETFDSCPEDQERTADKIEGKYLLYRAGKPFPEKWNNRRDAYDGEKIMKR